MDLKTSYAKILSTPEGRHVIMDLLLHTGVFTTGVSVEDGNKDYRIALRDAGLYAFDNVLTAGPKTLTIMMEENIERTRNDGNE